MCREIEFIPPKIAREGEEDDEEEEDEKFKEVGDVHLTLALSHATFMNTRNASAWAVSINRHK